MRQPAFAWLWLGVLVGNTGTYMQALGAQWLLVDAPDAAAVVALVQTASMLPIMLFAVPAGVLADAYDRRWLLVTVQGYFLLVSGTLLVLTVLDLLSPALLLAFTFLLGVGAAAQLPAWQACTPDLVPRSQIRAAARLDMVGLNVARAVGPALAGLVIARAGVPAVFGLNALSVVPFGVALLMWRRRPARPPGAREPFWPSLRAGARYSWQDTAVRRVLLRVAVFILPAASMWALLPVVANQRLGLGADGYGLLFAAVGVGAVLGALVLGPVRRRLSLNAVLLMAGVAMSCALALLVNVPGLVTGCAVLVVAGLSWTATVSTLVGELRLFLPPRVMARGMAVWTMVFTGAQALGAVVWGAVAQQHGLVATFVAAAALSMVATALAVVWRVDDASDAPLERTAAPIIP